MKVFLDEYFLLETTAAERLYHDYARYLPIIDYHNHLPPKDVAENRTFDTLTQAWLEGDHYKWRAMRANGIDEKFITGDASDEEKFQKWADTVPYTMRNPLYHWTHLELNRYFGISELLEGKTSQKIYKKANNKLKKTGARDLLKDMRVEVICTTDDPADDLQYHQQMRGGTTGVEMLPTFRPDKFYAIDQPAVFKRYLENLTEKVGFDIQSFDDLLQAAQARVDHFHECGCRLSDHGFECLYAVLPSITQSTAIFQQVMDGKAISTDEVKLFRMTVLIELCKMYHAKGWTQQFHLGAIRNNNQRAFENLGPDTGFDSIGDFSQMRGLSGLLSNLDHHDQLPQTVLYNLNPRDNEAFATMAGNFNDGSIAGKIQFGSGWWFLDQKDGIEKQINALSNMGMLSHFVGMLTDSRSFLSFPRHEYFRRILCNIFGNDIEKGELPNDFSWIGQIVQNICYYNAKSYFNFES